MKSLRLYDPTADFMRGKCNIMLRDVGSRADAEGARLVIRMLLGEYQNQLGVSQEGLRASLRACHGGP